MRLLACFILAVACTGPQRLVADFQPVGFALEDRALALPVDEGVRRVRISALDTATGSWEVVTIAHIDGRSGHMKLRLPDGVPLDELRCEISRSDPFPASYYSGATSFSESADDSSNFRGIVNAGGPEDGDTTEPTSETTVEESDIWKWRDRTLYFFNTYRGLQVFDLSDLDDPRRTASLRMPAVGEQMYLVGDEHVALLANNWNSWYGGSRTASSEVILIHHEGDSLEITARFDVEGTFVESRLVGQTLYAVTRVYEQYQEPDETWRYRSGLKVYRFRLDDPDNPESGEPLELMGDENSYYYQAVVTATPDNLYIIPTVYSGENNTSQSEVHIVSISDPSEPLEIRSILPLSGRLNDKFKLREKDGVLTTVTQLWEDRKTRVATFDLNAEPGATPPLLGSVDLAPGETVRATRFDGDRLYVVTFRQIDPLFMIDLSDPARPEVLAELEIPGWSTYLEPLGDRLLSVGVEDRRVAVSLFDVTDPASLSMLERTYLGEEDSYSWSEANYDEKAIGFFPDDGLLVLPFSSYADGTHQALMQVIDVGSDDLTRRGVIDSEFNARRSQAIETSLVAISGRELLVIDLADRDEPTIARRLSVAWPVDRVAPVGDDHLAQFGSENGYWWGDSTEPATMRVTRTEDLDTIVAELSIGKGGQVAGSVTEGNHLHLLTARPEYIESSTDVGTTWTYETTFIAHVVDVSQPETPVILGATELTLEGLYARSRVKGQFLPGGELVWYPEEGGAGGDFWGYPEIDFAPGRGDIWWPYYGSNSDQVIVLRVSDPAQPEVIAHLSLMDPASNEGIYRQTGPVFFHTDTLTFGFQESSWLDERYQSRSFVQQVILTDPALPTRTKAVNCPGLLEHILATDSRGFMLFTNRQKIKFDETDKRNIWTSDAIIEASVYDGLNAFRVGAIEIADGAYTPFAGYERFLIRPLNNQWWNPEVTDHGLQVIEWDLLEGVFAELPPVTLETSPQSLAVNGHLLFGFGGGGVDAIAVHQLPDVPAVVTHSSPALASLWGARHVALSPDLNTAWIPVEAYGVEAVDVSALAPASAPTARSVAHDEAEEWIPIDLFGRHLVVASSEDFVGPIPPDYDWRLQPDRPAMSYETWAETHFGSEQDLPLPDSDSDADGWSNLAEFALGTVPDDARSRAILEPRLSVSGNALSYTFTRDPTAADVLVEPEVSSDLISWTAAVSAEGVTMIDDGWIVSVRLERPVTEEPRRFVRLKFILNEAE